MGHIFISYSRKDEKYVTSLVEALEKEGFDAWIDREMLTSDEWVRIIKVKIDECDAFIVVMTENSESSTWVRREVLYAMQKRKKIFPLLLQGELWMLLQDINFFDVSDGSLPNKKFFEHLARVVPRNKAWELAEEEKRRYAERIAQEKAEREAAEKDAREKAEHEAAEKAAREKAERESAEKATREKLKREFTENAAREKKERETAEKAAREKAERETAEKAAREKAERESAEKAARENAERKSAEKAAREKLERETAEKAAREKAERESAEKVAREKRERESAEKVAREKAEREAAEKAKRESVEKIARENVSQERPKKAVNKNIEHETVATPQKWTAQSVVLIVSLALIVLAVILSNLPSLTPADLTPTLIPVISTSTLPPVITTLPPNDRGIKMELIPAGIFKMGSNESDEKPIHEVSLDAYYMDVYEVTNAAYKLCVSDGACDLPSNTNDYDNSTYVQHPVTYVDWNQAETFCEWRGARLPTEAEWEKAARGTDGRTYPWGEGISCDKANYGGCVDDTTKVGSYESGKSAYGMYDMAGNVWEWVNDWYSETYYQTSPSSNPLGPSSGQYRVLRGGSWGYDDSGVRSAIRLRSNPTNTISQLRFSLCPLTSRTVILVSALLGF